MASAAGVTPDELRAAGRSDAADMQVTVVAAQPSPGTPEGVEVLLAQIGGAVEDVPAEKREEAARIALSVLRAMR